MGRELNAFICFASIRILTFIFHYVELIVLSALCVCGNKCDLESHRQVPEDLAHQFAASIGAGHFEVSALSSHGMVFIFLLWFLSPSPFSVMNSRCDSVEQVLRMLSYTWQDH